MLISIRRYLFVQITTDYNSADSCSECFALEQYNAGDQVCTHAIAPQCHC